MTASLTRKRSQVRYLYRPRTKWTPGLQGCGVRASLVRRESQKGTAMAPYLLHTIQVLWVVAFAATMGWAASLTGHRNDKEN